MSRTGLFRTAAAVLALAMAASVPAVAQSTNGRRMNVLFIAVDDMNTALGCYGHPLVKSPNMDRLAKRGVRFDRAYCQYPLCNPSRSSLLSGRRPDTTRVFDNGTRVRRTVPNLVTLPQAFKNAGYFSGRVGKIFHYGVPNDIGTSGLDDPESWDEVFNPRGRDKDDENEVINFTPKRQIGAALSWMVAKGEDAEQTDAKVADETIRMLERHRTGPFFIGCGFYRPHVPDVATQSWYDLYPMDRIHLPHEPDHMASVPAPAITARPPNYGLPEEKLRIFTRAYYAAVSFVDSQVGRVVDALDRLGLANNTVIVLFGDHGWLLGEHGQWQKQSLFEESTRVPLIIVWPGAKGNGRVSRRVVELVDLYPTLTDLCGLPAQEGLEGVSLRPLLANPNARWDRPAFIQVIRGGGQQPRFFGRTIRTERWRYTEWDGGAKGVELYDHDHDPHEYRNLAADPAYASTIADLSARLRAQSK